MGFGFLFVGYLFTFNFVAYNGYTDVLSTLLMLLGLSTLSAYGKSFKQAFFTGLPLVLLHAGSFVVSLGALIELFTVSQAFTAWLSMASLITKAVFLFFVLTGIAEISRETDIPVLRLRALRNRIFTLVFLALGVLLESDLFKVQSKLLAIIAMLYMILGLLVTFLNAKCFYEAYIWICLEGEENMERRQSRFGFINRLNAFSDKMEEQTLARRAEDKKRKEENKQKRNRKK
ncbi:MAG: hypothetical protein J6W28_07755 [Clostridia bacterium]|nr:hypothetical protein [Clostridia bacterium]